MIRQLAEGRKKQKPQPELGGPAATASTLTAHTVASFGRFPCMAGSGTRKRPDKVSAILTRARSSAHLIKHHSRLYHFFDRSTPHKSSQDPSALHSKKRLSTLRIGFCSWCKTYREYCCFGCPGWFCTRYKSLPSL